MRKLGIRVHPALAEAIEAEVGEARRKLDAGDALKAFTHQEQHIRAHVRAHWAMLRYAWQCGSTREVVGQLGRLTAATLFTSAWVPEGTTEGTFIQPPAHESGATPEPAPI